MSDTIRRATEQPEANRAQIEIWLWAGRNDPEFAARLYDRFIDSCKGFLRQAKEPLPENELETVTRVVVALVDGFCMQLVTHGDEKKVLRETESATAMLKAYLD